MIILSFFPLAASGVTYLFLRMEPLDFDNALYGYYLGNRSLVTVLALFVAIPWLKV